MTQLVNFLQSIANAIKNINGKSEKITPKNFPTEISKLSYIDDNINGKINKVSSAKPQITINDDNITAQTIQETGYVSDGGTKNSIELKTKEGSTIIPTVTDQVIEKGQYLKGDQIILGDSNLISENILRGKNNKLISIYGVQGKIDKIHRIVSPIVYSNMDIQVLDVAKSYYYVAMSEIASFQYSQSKGLFYSYLTDSNGNCCIDCSSYGSFIVRGIDYFNSPYNGATGAANLSNDPKNVKLLCENSSYEYADKYLDRQLDNSFFNLGYSSEGLYSIRNAAQLAEYYYCKGYTVYEYETSPTSIPSGLKGGELIFWSKESAKSTQKSRFKAISHVGIIDRTGKAFYQVTGSENKKEQTVYYNQLKDYLKYITLIVKPNYGELNTKVGMELLPKYYFDSCPLIENILNGVTFTINKDGGFSISNNIPTNSTTFYIINKTNYIILDPGTYKLSGCVPHETILENDNTSTKWGLSIKNEQGNHIKDINGIDVWDRGYGGSEFTITEQTKIYIYFYISSNLTSMNQESYNIKPSLIRLS